MTAAATNPLSTPNTTGTPATDKPKPKTTDFQVGRYYSPAFVADVFGLTGAWARKECAAGSTGRFPNAVKLPGGRSWLIPGGDVLALIGRQQLDRDRAAMAAALPTPAQRRREAEAGWERLQRIEGSKKKRAKAGRDKAGRDKA